MKNLTVNHSTNAFLRNEKVVAHAADANKIKETGVAHTADALKERLFARSHQTDAFKRRAEAISHTTDVSKSGKTVSHTTDAIMRREVTDASLDKADTIVHTTDADKKRGLTVAQNTETLKEVTVTLTHGTDAFKRSDANKRRETAPPNPAIGGKPEDQLLSPSTDSTKQVTTPQSGTVLADNTTGTVLFETTESHISLVTGPEMSKNLSMLVDIGDHLSVRVGPSRMATWNTLGRPTNPRTGTIGFNTQTNMLETWHGNSWFTAPLDPV